MTVFNRIVPGKADNGGIADRSIPEYTQTTASAPLHLPVVSVVTPKGKLAKNGSTQWISPKDFKAIFGDIFDAKKPFYNPISVLINRLAAGGQSTIGVRRLSVNDEVARVAMSAFVQKITVQDYERDSAGRFKYDADGNKIPVAGKTFSGLSVEVKPDPLAATTAPGQLEVRTIAAAGEVPETVIYPLFEALAGVGDEYNQSGLNMGVRNETMNWRSISDFVKATGVFPFDLRQFTDAVNGERTYTKTPSGRESAKFTLFPTELNNVNYSLVRGFGEFTGTNQNRPTQAVPAPFNDLIVYDTNIDTLCQLMYVVEKDNNPTLLEVGNEGEYYKQMNPLGCTNHTGSPYYAVQLAGTIKWDLSGSVKAAGGISPFLDKDGNVPSYVTVEELNDPFGLLTGVKRPLNALQAWEINNKLMASDLQGYVNGIEMKDVTRNRQSLWWDVGFTQDVKDIQAGFLGARKDILVIPCATIWTPGKANALEEVYSRASLIVNQLRMTPESEKWGTPASRAAVNIIEVKITNENTGWLFSGNIDLAHKFAQFAGSNSGLISVPMCPDHGDNRILTEGHTPNIVFEEDEVASENFNQGLITLKPYDWNNQVYRPGLPTVQTNPDSVLKDLVTPFLCVCMEKLSADQWKLVCGDTTITADNYSAIMKDNIEKACRTAVGGMVSNITAETFYEEGTVGSRAKLSVKIHAWFNKAKYMMEFDLFAYNQQDLAVAA
ncbi:hypothetical protein D3C81_288150 [compost metagenome]